MSFSVSLCASYISGKNYFQVSAVNAYDQSNDIFFHSAIYLDEINGSSKKEIAGFIRVWSGILRHVKIWQKLEKGTLGYQIRLKVLKIDVDERLEELNLIRVA